MSTTPPAPRIGQEATVTPAGSSEPVRGFVSDLTADGQVRLGAYPGVPRALTEPIVVPFDQVVEVLDIDSPDGWNAITLTSGSTGEPIASIRLTNRDWGALEETARHGGETVEDAVVAALREAVDARTSRTD